MPVGVITATSDAQFDALGRYVVTEAQQMDMIMPLLGPEPKGKRRTGYAGIKLPGFQGSGVEAMMDRHLVFRYRNRSHIRLTAIPAGATMSSNYQEFGYDDIAGQREFFGMAIQSGAFFESYMSVDVAGDLVSELVDWVQAVPYAWQWMHALSPSPYALASMTTTAALKNALRGQTLTNIQTVINTTNIGNPGGNAPASYTNVRCGILDAANGDILRAPDQAWDNASDNQMPTYDNTARYVEYVRLQNYDKLNVTVAGINIDSQLTIVPPTWFRALEQDARFQRLEDHVFAKGDNSIPAEGFKRVLYLHGHYFVEWPYFHPDMENGWPGYSYNIGGGLAVYLCPTLSAGSFMSSMFRKATFTDYKPDHHTYQKGIYVIIGTKMLASLTQGTTTGTSSTKDLVSFMVTVAPTGGGAVPAYVAAS